MTFTAGKGEDVKRAVSQVIGGFDKCMMEKSYSAKESSCKGNGKYEPSCSLSHGNLWHRQFILRNARA